MEMCSRVGFVVVLLIALRVPWNGVLHKKISEEETEMTPMTNNLRGSFYIRVATDLKRV